MNAGIVAAHGAEHDDDACEKDEMATDNNVISHSENILFGEIEIKEM